MSRAAPALLLLAALLLAPARGLRAEGEAGAPPPKGRALRDLVTRWIDAGPGTRAELRAELDREYAPLLARDLPRLRKEVLKAACEHGPEIARSGTAWLLPEERGRYIVQGRPSKTLFIGLHGGGEGSGSAESAAGAMGGGGWWWLFPEVLEKTERGWTTSGTEEFVLALVEAAKRTGKVDPNRIYITGHSMGGFGAWTLGAHHADVFAGVGAYAGAPIPIWRAPEDHTIVAIEPGVLPSYFNLRLHVYQSLDDPQVPPDANIFATAALAEWKARFPEGFDYRYDEVDGRGHAAPAEGYLPSLRWLAERERDPRPVAFLWQPALPWKRQHFWVHWDRPELGALLEVRAPGGNVVEITTHEGSGDVTGLSVLVGPPLLDPEQEVVVRVNGEERWRGVPVHTLSTLLMTAVRYDEHLLFDARIDL